MPKLSLEIPHSLDQEEAVRRLKDGFSRIKETYGGQIDKLEETWNDHQLVFSFVTFGLTIQGSVSVEPSEVKITAELPLAATMFKGTIEQQIRDEVAKLLT